MALLCTWVCFWEGSRCLGWTLKQRHVTFLKKRPRLIIIGYLALSLTPSHPTHTKTWTGLAATTIAVLLFSARFLFPWLARSGGFVALEQEEEDETQAIPKEQHRYAAHDNALCPSDHSPASTGTGSALTRTTRSCCLLASHTMHLI